MSTKIESIFSDCICDESSSVCQIISSSKDGKTIYIWTEKGGLVACCDVKSSIESQDLIVRCNLIVNLNLSQLPNFQVTELCLNSSGSILLLIGLNGILVVFLPTELWSYNSLEHLSSDYLCRSELLDVDLFGRNSNLSCLKVRWHPGSRNDNHATVLFSDNVLRIYNVNDPEHAVQRIGLNCLLDFELSVNQTFRNGLGETAVSFDFGVPFYPENNDEGDPLWPVFLLFGTGELFSVLTDVIHYRSYNPCGPLTMNPPAEDNYGIDSCDIICISDTPIPVVVIVTAYGVLYHCVLIQDNDTLEPQYSIHVYESVQLELSLSTVDLKTGKQHANAIAPSSLLLIKDPLLSTRFFCIHSSGVHGVDLSWIYEMNDVVDEDGDSDQPVTNGADVDYLVCVKPDVGGVNRNIRGLAVLHSSTNERSVSTLMIVVPDWTVYAMEIGIASSCHLPSSESTELEQTPKHQEYFIDQIKRMLHRNCSAPVLKSKSKQLSEKESGELLMRAVEIFKTEYVTKLNEAKRFTEQRISLLCKQKENQQTEISRCENRCKNASESLKRTKNRLAQANERQNSLCERLEELNLNINCGAVPVSLAERKLESELEQMRLKANANSGKIQKIARITDKAEKKQSSAESINRKMETVNLDSTHEEKAVEKIQIQLESLENGIKSMKQNLCIQ